MLNHSKQQHQESVDAAFAATTFLGDELRADLRQQLLSKVLLRQAKDVVLLTGPTGAGKEKVAAVAHDASQRALGRSGELVEINCANFSGTLFESELFGYRRGAFTGADRDHAGLIAKAQGGTLVLDEVQALEPQNQARLLRFLGEREFRAVGHDRVQKSDALIILASNKNLNAMVQEGTFRRDLLDRAPAKITLPPLFERRRDIATLAQSFALEAARDAGAAEDTFFGLTRQAQSDLAAAVVRHRECSVRRLREIVRNAVFYAAADSLPEAIDSDFLSPVLAQEFSFDVNERGAHDAADVGAEFDLLVAATQLEQLAKLHGISRKAIQAMSSALETIVNDLPPAERSYRNVVERSGKLAKVALWLVSGAKTQAEFRRYFGSEDFAMPTKSVAHQIFYEVFPTNAKGDA